MRGGRRDRFISAAQVAYHFPYKLDEALNLSRDERELLLAVVVSEQERQMDRIERSLGITWDIATLAAVDTEDKLTSDGKPKPMPSSIKIPLMMALAPEFFKILSDEYRTKYRKVMEAVNIAGGGPVIEVGNLSAEEAKAFYAKIGHLVASQPTPE